MNVIPGKELELVFNELSIEPPAENKYQARTMIANLLQVMKKAFKAGVRRSIRTSINFFAYNIAKDYSISNWIYDREVDKETRLYFKALSKKSPSIECNETSNAYDSFLLTDYKYQGIPAKGLGFACLTDNLALSIDSDEKWNSQELSIDYDEIDESGNLSTSTDVVKHASKTEHITQHNKWIVLRIRSGIINGEELWRKRNELFPSLEFCGNVENQLKELSGLYLNQAIKKLFELELYFQNSAINFFNADLIPSKATQESESRKTEFRRKLTFLCPDGINRLFSWHLRMTPGAERLHFFPKIKERKFIVGYIGPKIL